MHYLELSILILSQHNEKTPEVQKTTKTMAC